MHRRPLRHLITATTALTFVLVVAACNAASPRALPQPQTGATPAAPAPTTSTPSAAAPTTSTPRATRSSTGPPTANANACVPFRATGGFYEAATIGTEELTTPTSRCTTISVSDVEDPASRAPTDTCGSFRVGFWPLTDNGSLTYTEPVIACSSFRTVLARNVPNNARYLVIYDVEYIEPTVQNLTFRIWH
jgi:hypothetical protein